MNAISGPSGDNSDVLKKGISDADHIKNGTKWVCILTGKRRIYDQCEFGNRSELDVRVSLWNANSDMTISGHLSRGMKLRWTV